MKTLGLWFKGLSFSSKSRFVNRLFCVGALCDGLMRNAIRVITQLIQHQRIGF